MKILLGSGVFSINGTPIGLTRGGGRFTLEREIREIEADGDRGPVKGRIEIDREVPKLAINALTFFDESAMATYYPGLAYDEVLKKVTSTLKIADTDYLSTVSWEGKTKDGAKKKITVENAINLENIDWELVDKSETVAALVYTGAYDEAARDTPPWDVSDITA